MTITLWQSNPRVGKANIDQSDSTSHVDSIVGAEGRRTDPELAANTRAHGAAGIIQSIRVEFARHRPQWRRWVGQKIAEETRRNNAFMAVLSHELRNSLSGIRSAAGILRRDVSANPSAVKARVLIERQVDQMTRLVEDLMDLTQIRSGQLRLQRERIDLCALVAQSVQTVELALQQRSHRLTLSAPDAPVWLQADATRLEQVFVNLLVNAAKYTAAGGDIRLSVATEKGEAIVRISDTGIGIAADVLPKVFDLFVQADPSSSRASIAGLGIGLALVRSLVESHGGRVSAASPGLERGSEFTVRLPLASE
jgi:two-component system, sensor histidine kinase